VMRFQHSEKRPGDRARLRISGAGMGDVP
jgi:hypothetical protein